MGRVIVNVINSVAGAIDAFIDMCRRPALAANSRFIGGPFERTHNREWSERTHRWHWSRAA